MRSSSSPGLLERQGLGEHGSCGLHSGGRAGLSGEHVAEGVGGRVDECHQPRLRVVDSLALQLLQALGDVRAGEQPDAVRRETPAATAASATV